VLPCVRTLATDAFIFAAPTVEGAESGCCTHFPSLLTVLFGRRHGVDGVRMRGKAYLVSAVAGG